MKLVKRSIGILLLASITVLLVFLVGRKMVLAGAHGEAKLNLTYLHTLQKAYYLQHKNYVPIASFYGAQIQGSDNCKQPEGASQLGFIIHWCHSPKATPARYAYRVSVAENNYQSEAHSGSDTHLESFVCYGTHEKEIWVMNQEKELFHSISCN